jgi:hypothetical protein
MVIRRHRSKPEERENIALSGGVSKVEIDGNTIL